MSSALQTASVSACAVPTGVSFSSYVNAPADICPKCGEYTGMPLIHDEVPNHDALRKIALGELIWISAAKRLNSYRMAANRKCIGCEFEWRE